VSCHLPLNFAPKFEKEIKQQNISALQQAADEIKVMFSAMEKPGKKQYEINRQL